MLNTRWANHVGSCCPFEARDISGEAKLLCYCRPLILRVNPKAQLPQSLISSFLLNRPGVLLLSLLPLHRQYMLRREVVHKRQVWEQISRRTGRPKEKPKKVYHFYIYLYFCPEPGDKTKDTAGSEYQTRLRNMFKQRGRIRRPDLSPP